MNLRIRKISWHGKVIDRYCVKKKDESRPHYILIPVNVNGKISTNGSSLGGSRVGESNDLVTGDSGVLTLPNHGNHWPRCNILDQGRIKGLFGMFSVELLSEGTPHLDQLQGCRTVQI